MKAARRFTAFITNGRTLTCNPPSSSSQVEIKIQKIAFDVALKLDNNYGYASLDLKGDDVAKILGISKSEIASKVKFYGVEPDGTLNSRTTGEGTGHWFDKDGKIDQNSVYYFKAKNIYEK